MKNLLAQASGGNQNQVIPSGMPGGFAPSNVTIDLRSSANEIASQTNFSTTVEGYIRGLLVLGGFLTFFYMLYGAFEWITAGGESGKIEAARKKITQGVIGLVLLASTAAIWMVIQYFLGITILSGGGATGGGNTGAGTCAGGVAINATANDGGAGGYCQTTAGAASPAIVRCVAAGVGPSGFDYPHFEPVSCVSPGQKAWNWVAN